MSMTAPPLRLAAVALMTALCAAGLAGCNSASNSTSSTSATPSAATASSAAASSFPVTIQAPNGTVTIKAMPTRIVSLSPTATEDLYAVGAAKQVVAVDQDSNYPVSGVPKISVNGMTPNIKAIARYNPDLIVTWQSAGGQVAQLAKLGVPVLLEPTAGTLAGAYTQIEQIGEATGHAAQAHRVVGSMEQQIAASVKEAGADHKDLTYYWEIGANPYYSATSSTFIGQIIGLFGLKNIADAAAKSSDGGYPKLPEKYIITAAPQIIFLAQTEGIETPAAVAKRSGWSAIPALRHHDVIALNADVASRWGPRLAQLVAQIAVAIEHAAHV